MEIIKLLVRIIIGFVWISLVDCKVIKQSTELSEALDIVSPKWDDDGPNKWPLSANITEASIKQTNTSTTNINSLTTTHMWVTWVFSLIPFSLLQKTTFSFRLSTFSDLFVNFPSQSECFRSVSHPRACLCPCHAQVQYQDLNEIENYFRASQFAVEKEIFLGDISNLIPRNSQTDFSYVCAMFDFCLFMEWNFVCGTWRMPLFIFLLFGALSHVIKFWPQAILLNNFEISLF